MNGIQNSELDDEDLDPEADDVDSFEKHIDNLFVASEAQKCKRCKTTEFWVVKTIANGRKIVLRFNENLQPVGDEAGILSGILGLLGSDYTKFSICKKD
ncbi:hypothetical protein AHAS_Ahas13G0180900 [Arachis hypogaea]